MEEISYQKIYNTNAFINKDSYQRYKICDDPLLSQNAVGKTTLIWDELAKYILRDLLTHRISNVLGTEENGIAQLCV